MIAAAEPDSRERLREAWERTHDWLTVTGAVPVIGCTSGWIRILIRNGKLPAWRAGHRAWLIKRTDAIAARANLGPLSNAKKIARAFTAPRRAKAK